MKLLPFLLLFVSIADVCAAPAQVLIIRHAEKPEPEGRELSEKGFRRAKALVKYFQEDPEMIKHGAPVAIYAMKPKDAEGSVRPIQTVTPLAQALGIPVQTPYRKDNFDLLAEEILANKTYDGKTVVICWEHKLIPNMAKSFGVKPKPESWPKDDYSTVYSIEFQGRRVSRFMTFDQNLPDL